MYLPGQCDNQPWTHPEIQLVVHKKVLISNRIKKQKGEKYRQIAKKKKRFKTPVRRRRSITLHQKKKKKKYVLASCPHTCPPNQSTNFCFLLD